MFFLPLGGAMSELHEEVVSSVEENISNKRKSPLYGAFLFAWLAYNWQPILVLLFFKGDITARLDAVAKYASLYSQVFGPIWVATVIVLLFPLCHGVYSFFDAWIGSLYDTSKELRETFGLENRSKLVEKRVRFKSQKDITEVNVKQENAALQKQAAEDMLRAKEIEAEIQSIDVLKNSLVQTQGKLDEALNSNVLLESQVKRLQESSRGSYLSRIEISNKASQLRSAIKDGSDSFSIDKYLVDLVRMAGVSDYKIVKEFENPQNPS